MDIADKKLAEKIYGTIADDWIEWADSINAKKFVIGISGGVDSTTAAALACNIFGRDNVVGVSLPCDGQKDMDDVNEAFAFLGIRRLTIDIGDMFASIKQGLENNCIDITEQTRINAPARLRMAMLYAVSQSLGAYVVNTCNRSETVVGNDTRWGDQCGDYAPLKNLTKTEVINLAMWLGVPEKLAKKTPVDGLQPLSDEDRLGMKYRDIDNFIRMTDAWNDIPKEIKDKIQKAYCTNKFKIYGVNIAGPEFDYLPDIFNMSDI